MGLVIEVNQLLYFVRSILCNMRFAIILLQFTLLKIVYNIMLCLASFARQLFVCLHSMRRCTLARISFVLSPRSVGIFWDWITQYLRWKSYLLVITAPVVLAPLAVVIYLFICPAFLLFRCYTNMTWFLTLVLYGLEEIATFKAVSNYINTKESLSTLQQSISLFEHDFYKKMIQTLSCTQDLDTCQLTVKWEQHVVDIQLPLYATISDFKQSISERFPGTARHLSTMLRSL